MVGSGAGANGIAAGTIWGINMTGAGIGSICGAAMNCILLLSMVY